MDDKPRKKGDAVLLLALACGATVEAAARQAGLTKRTVYRRLADPDFRSQLQSVRADVVQRTAGALTAASTEAVKALLALMQPATPPPVRLGAARAVLELGTRLREAAELEERLAALEQQVAAQAAGA
jgi:hypothetical protein